MGSEAKTGIAARTFALAVGITLAPAAQSHSENILEACPNLKDGAVRTTVIASDFSFNADNWRTYNPLTGDVDQHSTSPIRDNLLFRGENTDDSRYDLITINSYGGEANQGISLVNRMTETGRSVTLCASRAGSAAFIVLANGAERYALPDCTAITHKGYGEVSGSPEAIKQYLATFENEAAQYQEMAMRKTMIGNACFKALTNNGDYTLNARDMLNLGVVNAILYPSDEKMEVREDDQRIAFQQCMKEQLADIGTTDGMVPTQVREQIANQCWERTTPTPTQ